MKLMMIEIYTHLYDELSWIRSAKRGNFLNLHVHVLLHVYIDITCTITCTCGYYMYYYMYI